MSQLKTRLQALSLLDRAFASLTDDELEALVASLPDDHREAVDEICSFYARYHSMRFVGRRLVLRLTSPVDDDELVELNSEFADIINGTPIEALQVDMPLDASPTVSLLSVATAVPPRTSPSDPDRRWPIPLHATRASAAARRNCRCR